MAWTAMLNRSVAARTAPAGRRIPSKLLRLTAGAAAVLPSLAELTPEVRHRQRTRALRIGQQIILGALAGEAAGRAYTALAEDCIQTLAEAVCRDMAAVLPNPRVAVVGLGKLGSREMTAASDLDLVVLYEPDEATDAQETLYGQWLHRLIGALSARTEDGPLYSVDLRLRPYGDSGPAAAPLAGVARYLSEEAETWEILALTRARVVWSSAPLLEGRIRDALTAVLRAPRDAGGCARDTRAMRRLMAGAHPPNDAWDCKRSRGGLIDIAFCAQYLQIIHGAAGGPLAAHTGDALRALHQADLLDSGGFLALMDAWSLQQHTDQLFKAALPEGATPEMQGPPVQALLACTVGARDLKDLKARLSDARQSALGTCRRLLNAQSAAS